MGGPSRLFLFVVAFTFIVTVSSFGQLKFSDFKLAFDAGLIRYIASGQRSADWAALAVAGNYTNNYYVNVVDCVATPDFYPFPDPTTADREFKRILHTQLIYIGDVVPGDINFEYYLFFNRTLAYINANYGTSITYQIVTYPSSVALFTGLLNGEFDITTPNALEGGFYLNYRRNQIFPRSCAVSATTDTLYVLNANTTLDVIRSSGGTICVQGTGSFQILAATFGATNNVIDIGPTGDCITGINNGQFIASNVDSGTFIQVPIPNEVLTLTSFFRTRLRSLVTP